MRTVEVRDGRPVVVRRGPGDAVRREAAILRAIAGPGAPAILACVDGVELVTSVLPPLPLEHLGPRAVASVVGDVAAVLARAHAAGFVHGPLRPEHVLGAPGDVLVSGWEAAGPGDPADDVAEVGQLLATLASGDPALLATAARARAPERPTMAALADLLRAPAHPSPHRRPPIRALVAVPAVATLVLALWWRASTHAVDARPQSTTPTTMQLGNVVERGGHRWRIGQPGDVVVAGAFGCDGVEAPATLRPSTGQVWVFASWSAGTGRLVATVPGATSAGIVHDGRCDRLEVRDRQGRWRAVG